MYDALAELILVNERSDYRFERFCLDIVGKHEGITYVPTSQSWDLGRDARSTSRGRGSHANILCATLNENLDAKVEADLLRVTALASPDRLVYCSSQKLSEHRIDDITAIIRRHAPNGSILVLSAIQLSQLALESQGIFEKYYRSELQEIRTTILSESPSGAPSNGLRLALLTFGSEEGADLRHEVLHATLLDKLSLTDSQTAQQICKAFSQDLGLPRVLPDTFLFHVLNQAKDDGDVERTTDGWRLTPAGKEKQSALPIEAVQHLLEGRRIIRASLEVLLGKSFSNTQYSALWTGLVDTLGAMFHANGLEIVKGVEQVISGAGATDQPLDLKKLLENGMARSVSVIKTVELREATYRALLDIFTERQGDGFTWLTRVAERFVTLCSIGLEDSSGKALRETLTAQRVVLDSDIILNFLCKAEPNHAASKDLLVGWLNIGGKILVSPVVLEEVAHNAWISDNDFKSTQEFIGKLSYFELTRYIKNPFVRTFHTLNAPAEQWPMYIGQYKGNSAGDYTKMLLLLRQRLKVEMLPTTYDETLKDQIIAYIRQLPTSVGSDAEHLEDVTFKIDRDGRLLASIASARTRSDNAGFDDPIVLLSSSGTLRATELKFQEELGNARLVLNKRAFSYLLASVPQSSLGADTLRRALFDFGSHGRLRSHDRKALRIIHSTRMYDMPWAERVTLRQQLSKAIKKEADRRGLTRRQVQEQIANSVVPDMTASIIVEAIQSMAIPTAVERELAESRRRVAELEQELVAREEILKRQSRDSQSASKYRR
jgi:hypothetical protein